MLSFFRKNHFIRSLFLLFYALILKFPLFFYEFPESASLGYVSDQLLGLIGSDTLAVVLAILLTYLQAVYLNKMVIENRITKESSLYPGVFYLLLTSIVPELSMLSAPLLGVFPMMIGIDYLMLIYKTSDYSGKVFNMGFWISLASLLYFPYLYFAIFFFIGISILKFIKGIDVIRMLIGVAVPYILMYYWLVWNQHGAEIFQWLFAPFVGRFGIPFSFSFAEGIKIVLLIMLAMIGVFNYNQFIKKKNVQAINKIEILFWGMVIAGVSALLATPLTLLHFHTLLPFVSVMMAMLFLQMQNQAVAEILHVAMLGLGFYVHYITVIV